MEEERIRTVVWTPLMSVTKVLVIVVCALKDELLSEDDVEVSVGVGVGDGLVSESTGAFNDDDGVGVGEESDGLD